MVNNPQIFGKGAPDLALSVDDLRQIVEESLTIIPSNSSILAVIPDTSRDDNTHLIFPIVAEILQNHSKFDALVAQGTHPPISEAEKLEKIGLNSFKGEIFDHDWSNPDKLTKIGKISAAEVSEITNGSFSQNIDLTINKLILDYDFILVLGATVPHEVAGFAGGAKYFFPGISGSELTNATHWIGALAGIENIIGRVETPTRHLIEKAADFIPKQIINFNSVVSRNSANQLQTDALFVGDFRKSFRHACEVSRQVHIKFVDRKYKKVVAILDTHYTELWTGGKASYKLGGIIEDGGELIIYAPHLTEISITHGEAIEKFGYAPIEKVKELVANSEELSKNLCVAAHLAHVSYAGLQKNPKKFKYQITLASQVDSTTCEKVNLNFADFREFNLEDFENDAETLIVNPAGRDLYLLGDKG
ncbi:MAG: lactate racemase domain-containing protein [Pyrinomonadaceae bacterium]|nr:lactate racemase domain-containing protein [Pyrinomonadaceae bacterium]